LKETKGIEEIVHVLGRIIRFLRFLVYCALAIWAARSLVRWLAGPSLGSPRGNTAEVSRRALARDPSCGVFVSPEISYSLESAGQVLHFCSPECREVWQAASRLRESA
jgi:YHS domain-containing protein